jgi:hypothetical protein
MSSSSSSFSSVSGGGAVLKHTQTQLLSGISQAQLWECCKDYIRKPDVYMGMQKVEILKDELEAVERRFFVPQANANVDERVTWSEQNKSIRIASVGDKLEQKQKNWTDVLTD